MLLLFFVGDPAPEPEAEETVAAGGGYIRRRRPTSGRTTIRIPIVVYGWSTVGAVTTIATPARATATLGVTRARTTYTPPPPAHTGTVRHLAPLTLTVPTDTRYVATATPTTVITRETAPVDQRRTLEDLALLSL